MTFKEFIEKNLENYKVYNEIKHSNSVDSKYIIINCVGGDNVYASGQTINYTLIVRSTNPDEAINDLKQFAMNFSGTYYEQDEEWQIKILCNMPYKAQAFQEANMYYYTEFILPVFCVATKNVSDVKTIYIDDEKIEFTNINIAYTTQTDNERVESNEINKTNITLSNLQLTFNSINYDNLFNNKVDRIMAGHLAKDSVFSVKISLTNDFYFEYNMKLTSCVLNTERANLPSKSYTFMV